VAKSRKGLTMAIKRKTKQELERMRQAGRLAAETLWRAGKMVKPGVTLIEIDQFVYDFTIKNNAIPAPLNYHGFPNSACTSVNEVVTHGIPDEYVLKEGDVVNIDITSRLKGYHGDTSRMFFAGDVSEQARDICKAARESMWEGIRAVKIGGHFGDIGNVIQDYADEAGYSVVRDYCGHGIGRGFHEDPLVLHYASNKRGAKFQEGMVFTIEPMLNEGTHKVKTLKDGWTVVTADGKLSAQEEHTMGLTENGLEIFTDHQFE
jgi:methionyl aminopeptidase